ncbi:MAG: alpha/beta hydrolase [Leptospiraceae bacterium]
MVRIVRKALIPLILASFLAISCQSSLEYRNPYGVSSVKLLDPEEPENTDPENAQIDGHQSDRVVEQRPYSNSHFTFIDGARIHFRWTQGDGGSGRYVLIHGFAASTYSYRFTIEHLKNQGHEILAIDLPGYGFSDRILEGSQSRFRRAQIVWQVIELISEPQDQKPWILVGHSMGGSVISAMAQLRPDSVLYMVYLAGSVDGGPGWITRNAVSWIPGLQSLVIWYAESFKFDEESFNELLESAYARPPEPEEVQGYLQPFLVSDTARSILASIENSGDERKLQLEEMNIPAILIWGAKDEWVDPKIGRKLHRDLQKSILYIIEDAGHCPMETHPEKVHEIMDANDSVMRRLQNIQPD